MTLTDTIKRLCTLSAPSGAEREAFDELRAMISEYTDEVKTDSMGNLIAYRRCGREKAPLLMLDAHMDEIGFIITGSEKGFLRFDTLGGVDPRTLPASEVLLLSEKPMLGVIDTMPPHVLSAEDMNKTVPRDKLYIDAGLTEEEADKLVPPGTCAVFVGNCVRLGENQLCCKALDDRACAAILVCVLDKLKDKQLNIDLCILISTQEELGMRGGKTGVFSIDPDYAIAVDVTHAHTPDAKKEETLEMGKGPAVAIGPNANRALTNAMFSCAKKFNIPHQTEVIPGNSGTNGWLFQVSRCGVPTAVVSLPIKYMHTPVETMDIRDGEALAELLCAFAENFEEVR